MILSTSIRNSATMTVLLLVGALLFAGTTANAGSPLCKGKPAERPPECDTATGGTVLFDAAFTWGTFELDPSPLGFIVDEMDINGGLSDAGVTLKGLNNAAWNAVFGVCAGVLNPLPDPGAGLFYPEGRIKISKAANVITIIFDEIVVPTASGNFAELRFWLQGREEGWTNIVLGTIPFEYNFTELGIFARTAKGSSGSKKRCQQMLDLPEAHSKLGIIPVN